VGSFHSSGTFNPILSLFKDEFHTISLTANDIIEVPNLLFVTVHLELPSTNTEFYVQVGLQLFWISQEQPANIFENNKNAFSLG